MLSSPLWAGDVGYYGAIKSIQYWQTNDTAPVLLATNAYMFTAFVIASTNDVVINATVKPSNTTPLRTLTPDTNGLSLRFAEQFSSSSTFDSVYPITSIISPVNYSFTIGTVHDGVQKGSVNFWLILPQSYPSTPQLNNLAAAQAVDTTQDFTVTWNSLGGSVLTIVQFTVLDAASNVLHTSALPFQPGALDGTSLSATIPAFTLPPGTALQGHLTVANPGMPNTNSVAGAMGVAALARDTGFPIITRPAPPQPRLQLLPAAAGQLQIHLLGETNRVYRLEASGDLTSWTNLFTTNCASGVFDYTDTPPVAWRQRFYRGVVGK